MDGSLAAGCCTSLRRCRPAWRPPSAVELVAEHPGDFVGEVTVRSESRRCSTLTVSAKVVPAAAEVVGAVGSTQRCQRSRRCSCGRGSVWWAWGGDRGGGRHREGFPSERPSTAGVTAPG